MSDDPKLSSIFKDETGDYSMARASFAVTVAFALYMVYQHSTAKWSPPDAAYALISLLVTGEIVWAAGSRGMQYLAPAITAVSDVMGKIGMRFAGRPAGQMPPPKPQQVVIVQEESKPGVEPPAPQPVTIVPPQPPPLAFDDERDE